MIRVRVLTVTLCIVLAACGWLDRRREERAAEQARQALREAAEAAQTRQALEAATARDAAPPEQAIIEFEATGEGNTVHFTIKNNGSPDLYVGPQNLALIPLPERELIHATDHERVLCRFYPVVLGLGDAAAGELVFLTVPDVTGMRLVFNSNQLDPSFHAADVEPPAPEEGASATP